MTSDDTGVNKIKIRPIALQGFDVSCVWCTPAPKGYWFGSEDGKVQFRPDLDKPEIIGPFAVVPSGEAINGIAISGDTIAVSTRGDVVFLHPSTEFFSSGVLRRATFPAGAHGVMTTQSGKIVAPMGRHGLLMGTPAGASTQRVGTLKPPGEGLNFYRVASVGSLNCGEFIACAARRGGFAAMSLGGNNTRYSAKTLRPAGVDLVDVASMGVDGYPFAVAAVGLDCSIHLMADLRDDRSSQTVHFNLDGERAYRIVCAEGHVFLLTNRRLHTFVNLAASILQGGAVEQNTLARSLDVEAVDMTLGFDRSLLVVMPKCVYSVEFDLLINGETPTQDHRWGTEGRMHAMGPDSVSDKVMGRFENSSWEQSENVELPVSLLTAN